MPDLKLDQLSQLNEGIMNLTGIDIMLIIILIILGLSLKKLVDMSAKIQTLEKLIKIDHRAIQIQTEEFNEEPISALHYKVREEQPKVFKQPTLINPVTLQDMSNDRASEGDSLTPMPMLDLRRFKETIVSYGMYWLFVKQMSNLFSVCNYNGVPGS